jgi:hypothetical protein
LRLGITDAGALVNQLFLIADSPRTVSGWCFFHPREQSWSDMKDFFGISSLRIGQVHSEDAFCPIAVGSSAVFVGVSPLKGSSLGGDKNVRGCQNGFFDMNNFPEKD